MGKKGIGSDESRLYNLIWKRTVACQMAPTEVEIKTVKIEMDNRQRSFFFFS